MAMSEDISQLLDKPFATRLAGYLRLTGPGYLQSAMTLGGGSIASCAALGSLFGYKYLWVQVVAMALGFTVLAAIAKQTCHSGERAYRVFWRELHPALAILWAVSALVATIIWHIPQYSLTANGVITLAEGLSLDLDSLPARIAMGAAVLAAAAGMTTLYHSGARGLKLYETVVKTLIWTIVVAFGIAAFSGDGVDWGRFFSGITGIAFLRDLTASGIEDLAIKPVVGAMAAAVGINMVFLYPYSLLDRGWKQEHEELARVDLVFGMALPFIIATGLMIMAVAGTIGPDAGNVGEEVRDVRQIIPVLANAAGDPLARLIVGLGVVAIGFSTIITHMLATGFIACELFGLSHEGDAKRWLSMLPAVGVVGVAIKFPIPLAITASTLAMPLMPVTVVCFLVLLNRPSYMGEAMPRGFRRLVWNTVLTLAIVVMTGSAILAIQKNWQSLQSWLSG